MGVKTRKYVKKPLHVEAVRVTRRNFNELVKWCAGKVQTEEADHPQSPGAKYIKIQAHNPINNRQTKAFVGDWILKTDRGFKVYTHQTFKQSFDAVESCPNCGGPEGYPGDHAVGCPQAERQPTYPHADGDFIVIGPQCFSAKDESVLNWKGVNYVPQNADRTIEAEVQAEMEKI